LIDEKIFKKKILIKPGRRELRIGNFLYERERERPYERE
jgi:hypothetical protein